MSRFDRPGVKASDLFSHPKEWLRYRLTGEQLIMNLFGLLNTYSTIELTRSGIKSHDPSRLYGGIAATTLNVWGLLSSRSAVEPEGKHFFERSKNAILHPDRSAVQFGWLISSLINSIFITGNLHYGIRNFGHETPDIDKIAKSRLYQAGFSTTVNVLGFSSLFTAPKPPPVTANQGGNAVVFKTSQSQPLSFLDRTKKVALYAYERDKGGLVGRSLSLAGNIARIYEAIKTIHLEQRDIIKSDGGSPLLRSTLANLVITLSQTYFNYSRMYEDAREERIR